MSIRYRVIRVCKQDNWETVLAGIRVERETQSLPVTFKTLQQAKKWTDFINARDLVSGRRKRKPGRVKFKQHSVSLKTLAFGRHSQSSATRVVRGVEGNIISRSMKNRLNAILKLSTEG